MDESQKLITAQDLLVRQLLEWVDEADIYETAIAISAGLESGDEDDRDIRLLAITILNNAALQTFQMQGDVAPPPLANDR